MVQYAEDLQSQNSNPALLSSGMIRPLSQIRIGEKAEGKKKD